MLERQVGIVSEQAAPWTDRQVARRMQTMLARMTALVTALVACVVAAPALAPVLPQAAPIVALARDAGLLSALAGLLSPSLAGLAGALLISRARVSGRRTGRSARLPQAVLVGGLALGGLVAVTALRGHGSLPEPSLDIAGPIGGVLMAIGFPLLIVERLLSATSPTLLPEAPDLRALVRLAMLGVPACGLLVIADGFGIEAAVYGIGAVAVLGVLLSAELAARAFARLFLPAPGDADARAACRSLLARLLAGDGGDGGLAGSVRASFGIDFARSWALAFIGRALLPTVISLAILVWALTGIAIVDTDRRAIVERFGRPVEVLKPGLHLVWPLPATQLRWLDYGVTRESDLAGNGAPPPVKRATADARAVPEADRLWSNAHPSERLFLIASASGDTQGFQAMDADVRLIWRVGDTDADAKAFVYGVSNPERLLTAIAGRAIESAFAGETLDALLGENRAVLAAGLRSTIQAEADRAALGIVLVAVVIEAMHPPIGAASAFQGVQAAQIDAQASVAAARREEIIVRSSATVKATETTASAVAGAAETRAAATVTLTSFQADRLAARRGGDAFRLERYLEDVVPALGRASLTVMDHRVPAAQAPTIDLRPLGAPGREDTE